MRILFVVPAYTPFIGGAQTFARAMARRLIGDGHRVTVLTTTAQRADDYWRPASGAALPLTEEIDGVHVVRLPIWYPWPAPYRFGVLRRLGHWVQGSPLPSSIRRQFLSYLARSMPPLIDLQSTVQRLVATSDLVQAIDATWDGLFTTVSQVAHTQGKPLVAIPLIHTGSTQIWSQFMMDHQRVAYRQAAAVITLTRHEKERLVSEGIPQARIHVVPMGVDVQSDKVPLQLVEDLCRRYTLKQPLVAFLGAATYDKGAFTLAKAVLDLYRRGQDWWVVCVGPQQEQLHRFITAHPRPERQLLQERIRLLGVVDEATKQTLLAACRTLALPSRVDSFGIVLLEAWQHGKPVVAATEGGLSEVVTPGETGLLVPFGDAKSLADALAQLGQNRDLAQRMGEAGRRTVMATYRWDCTYEALLDIYRHVARPFNRDSAASDDHYGRDGSAGDARLQRDASKVSPRAEFGGNAERAGRDD